MTFDFGAMMLMLKPDNPADPGSSRTQTETKKQENNSQHQAGFTTA
ncbi:hypothetical protein P4S64_05280 [Vibrio sp. M60_M31a]